MSETTELQPQLREAQQTLGEALKEACAMDPSKANTGELIHIEELLAIANESAKKAISVRRRLKSEPRARVNGGGREFVDGDSKWTAIAVTPSSSSSLNATYRTGWLSFDCGTETRRLAPIPENWSALSDDELRELCRRATVAQKKRKKV